MCRYAAPSRWYSFRKPKAPSNMLQGMCLRLLKKEFVLSIPDYPCCHRPSLHINLGELRNHQFEQWKKVVNFILAPLNPYPTSYTEPIHSSQNDTPIANVLQFRVASSKDHIVAQWQSQEFIFGGPSIKNCGYEV